jgi:serine/threonine-protein kinase
MRAGIVLLLGLSFGAQAQPPPRDPPRFPSAAPWYQDVSAQTPDPNSAAMIAASVGWGTGTTAFQIDFSMHVVYASWGGAQPTPLVQEPGYYLPDCDTGYAVPVPTTGAIESSVDYSCDYVNNDCHLFIVGGDTLYESYQTTIDATGLHSACLVKWHLNRLYPAAGRGDGCTSADAAGLPMAPLIFNPDEVYAAMQVPNGDLGHAIRFILPNGRMRANAFVHPASHYGAPNGSANAIPYGARLRLRANFDLSSYNAAAQVLLRTLKKYGMFLADGGTIPLTADDGQFTQHQWSEPAIAIDSHSLFGVALADFEVMPLGMVYSTSDCVRNGFGDDQIFADGYNW